MSATTASLASFSTTNSVSLPVHKVPMTTMVNAFPVAMTASAVTQRSVVKNAMLPLSCMMASVFPDVLMEPTSMPLSLIIISKIKSVSLVILPVKHAVGLSQIAVLPVTRLIHYMIPLSKASVWTHVLPALWNNPKCVSTVAKIVRPAATHSTHRSVTPASQDFC